MFWWINHSKFVLMWNKTDTDTDLFCFLLSAPYKQECVNDTETLIWKVSQQVYHWTYWNIYILPAQVNVLKTTPSITSCTKIAFSLMDPSLPWNTGNQSKRKCIKTPRWWRVVSRLNHRVAFGTFSYKWV